MDSINKILIIEDNPNDVLLIQHELNKAFSNIIYIVANSKADYREKIKLAKPDLILCDFDLPDGNGLDILLEIRRTTDTPFIFVSGTLDKGSYFTDAILGGADDYQLKDNIPMLSKQIEKILKVARVREDQRKERSKVLRTASLDIQKIKGLIEMDQFDKKKVIGILNDLQNKMDELSD